MKIKARWIENIKAEAAKTEIDMPWARGARRQEMKARRILTHTPIKQALSA